MFEFYRSGAYSCGGFERLVDVAVSYQLPPLITKKTAVVISPLISLMQDQAKRIVDNSFDKLPVHRLGRGKSSNWWKSLADQLLSLGYLQDVVHSTFRLISVAD